MLTGSTEIFLWLMYRKTDLGTYSMFGQTEAPQRTADTG